MFHTNHTLFPNFFPDLGVLLCFERLPKLFQSSGIVSAGLLVKSLSYLVGGNLAPKTFDSVDIAKFVMDFGQANPRVLFLHLRIL